jgi:HlyD family secretion protein
MRARLIVTALASVILLGGIAVVISRREARVNVVTTPATTGTVARQVLSTGTLEPVRMVEVGVQVSGTIAELPVDFNSVVKAGQVVARLDPSVYASQLEAARGQLAQAQAEASQMQTVLDDAGRKLARAEELAAQGLITRAELDAARITEQQAEADLKGRQAAIQSARAGVKQAQVDLERTVIRSPIDGVVVSRSVDVGQTVAATLQSPVLFTIADVRSMHLLTEVNEGEVGGVRRGSDVTFQVESLGAQTFHGTVADVRLQPYADQAGAMVAVATTGTGAASGASSNGTGGTATGAASGSTASTAATTVNATSASGSSGSSSTAPGAVTYTAVVDVPNQDGRLAPGGTAIVTMSGGSRAGVLRLPNNALSFRPSPQVLERTGQQDLPVSAGGAPEARSDRQSRISQVWRFENNRFVPVDVVTGLSDDRWTEMISGPVQAGDQLVTSAAPR